MHPAAAAAAARLGPTFIFMVTATNSICERALQGSSGGLEDVVAPS